MAIYDGKRLVHRTHITESEDIAKQDGQIVDSIVRNLLQGECDTISAMEADLSFVKEAKADQVVIDALVHVLEEEYLAKRHLDELPEPRDNVIGEPVVVENRDDAILVRGEVASG